MRAAKGEMDAAWLFDTGLHRHDGSRPDARSWLGAGEWRSFAPAAGRGPHDERIRSFSWTTETPVAWDALEAALETLLELRGERILRLKGLVNVAGQTGPVAVHAVQHTLYPPAKLAEWPDNDHRTRLVFITRDLEAGAVAPILDSFNPTVPAS
jgi:G3E family GTPase